MLQASQGFVTKKHFVYAFFLTFVFLLNLLRDDLDPLDTAGL